MARELFKIKQNLPDNYVIFLQSYLQDRLFLVKQGDAISNLETIHAGVFQGSVLGLVFYTSDIHQWSTPVIYTNDLPKTSNVTIGTFADDTVVLAIHENLDEATKILQGSLNKIEEWTTKWRIKVNEAKSIHVTFTMRRETCPPVKFNGKKLSQCDEVKYLGMHLDIDI